MRVLMLGWEFPPYISGGLGTACYGLTKAMSRRGMEIIFVLPRAQVISPGGHARILGADGVLVEGEVGELRDVRFRAVGTSLKPYARPGGQAMAGLGRREISAAWWSRGQSHGSENYGADIFDEVSKYAEKVVQIASLEDFDIVHAHDWMTFPAGMAVSAASGRPLAVHVHSTEFDRSGEHVNKAIYDIEREGMHAADAVIAVSCYTKGMIVGRYGVLPDKVEVVYNGVEAGGNDPDVKLPEKTDKVVLFLGRITMQKGPEYFLAAARKVLEKFSAVKFVVAGTGDMMYRMIETAAAMGIGHKVLFTGFLRGEQVDLMYRMADLYVMPSVSEPFGIAPLEALNHKVPVIISRQSGVAEVLKHALKVDFWDINQMANKILAVLRRSPLRSALSGNGHQEVRRFRWDDSAAGVCRVYERLQAPVHSGV